MGIDSSASPFLKITFETASHFLTVRWPRTLEPRGRPLPQGAPLGHRQRCIASTTGKRQPVPRIHVVWMHGRSCVPESAASRPKLTCGGRLQEATMRGDSDPLATPASRLVLGRTVELGTGCMELMQSL